MKVLVGLACGAYIVKPAWLEACLQAGCAVDAAKFQVKHFPPVEERCAPLKQVSFAFCGTFGGEEKEKPVKEKGSEKAADEKGPEKAADEQKGTKQAETDKQGELDKEEMERLIKLAGGLPVGELALAVFNCDYLVIGTPAPRYLPRHRILESGYSCFERKAVRTRARKSPEDEAENDASETEDLKPRPLLVTPSFVKDCIIKGKELDASLEGYRYVHVPTNVKSGDVPSTSESERPAAPLVDPETVGEPDVAATALEFTQWPSANAAALANAAIELTQCPNALPALEGDPAAALGP
jgi:hypothetical protein